MSDTHFKKQPHPTLKPTLIELNKFELNRLQIAYKIRLVIELP